MTLKKLPIGIQTFSEIREDDYVYIDKTALAYELLQSYKYVFLSRPRRFGKSLFLDTLRNIFEGNKHFFAGLAIEDKWDWDVSYPVIRVSFASGKIESREQLDHRLLRILKQNHQELDIDCEELDSVAGCFEELIRKTHVKYNQKVVVLVDEYDKPILDNIMDMAVAKEIRDGLVNFYSVIKGSDEFLRFAFLTGVSKFTKTSIFSGLNNITDISLQRKFGDICGYSQQDVETTFAPYLEGVDMDKVKEWYNGYNFLDSQMYNPFDILKFIANEHTFRNYWFESGTPTFLIELIKKQHYFLPSLTNLRVDEKLLNSFDIDNLDLEVILYQSGYLTIDTVQTTLFETLEYTLKIPNKEVKQSLNDTIIDLLIKDKRPIPTKTYIYKSLVEANMQGFKKALTSMFAGIPYHNYTNNDIKNYEGFYASVIYVYLQSLGLNIIGEDVTNQGRIDLTILMDQAIYIFEFKVDRPGQANTDALQQIKEKDYADKYLDEQKPIYLIGIQFDTEQKKISQLEWERVNLNKSTE
ncbi:ATP-binding protein [Thiomicrospira microaerophila]|uniref:ATP-binding protein n=1 Tax=Thiomicrospira microaerophila TaxID=406020 RepID=UPI00200D1239|nr:ATP-binding protein [Thiomicrospira microaerophila]UQB43291.1 ATP-binding protein [Thiomicrospira microaerophila]